MAGDDEDEVSPGRAVERSVPASPPDIRGGAEPSQAGALPVSAAAVPAVRTGGPAVPPVRLAGAALHPLLVTLPIGAFACTLAFDLASRWVEGYVFARGALWLVAIGLVSAVVAGAVGVVDGRRRAVAPEVQVLVRAHALCNIGAVVAFGIGLWVRRTRLDELVGGTPTTAVILSVAGVVLLGAGVLMGGRAAGVLDLPGVDAD